MRPNFRYMLDGHCIKKEDTIIWRNFFS